MSPIGRPARRVPLANAAPRLAVASELLPQRSRGSLRWLLPLTAALSLATLLVAGTGSATELLEARVTAGAAPVLQNVGGTVIA